MISSKTAPVLEQTDATGTEVLADRLRAIDWDFGERRRPHELEGIHPYPAKFIPAIPASVLSILPMPRDTVVYDPFCGSGTTVRPGWLW